MPTSPTRRRRRWRCLVPGCPTNGTWQYEPPGRDPLPTNHPDSHYMREHWEPAEPEVTK